LNYSPEALETLEVELPPRARAHNSAQILNFTGRVRSPTDAFSAYRADMKYPRSHGLINEALLEPMGALITIRSTAEMSARSGGGALACAADAKPCSIDVRGDV